MTRSRVSSETSGSGRTPGAAGFGGITTKRGVTFSSLPSARASAEKQQKIPEVYQRHQLSTSLQYVSSFG